MYSKLRTAPSRLFKLHPNLRLQMPAGKMVDDAVVVVSKRMLMTDIGVTSGVDISTTNNHHTQALIILCFHDIA